MGFRMLQIKKFKHEHFGCHVQKSKQIDENQNELQNDIIACPKLGITALKSQDFFRVGAPPLE